MAHTFGDRAICYLDCVLHSHFRTTEGEEKGGGELDLGVGI